MRQKAQSVVTLDPIERNNRRRSGPIGRFFKTKHFKGKSMSKTDPFGHYLPESNVQARLCRPGLLLSI